MANLRERLYRNLDPEQWPHDGLSPINRSILTIVLLSIFVGIVETEESFRNIAPVGFLYLNGFFAVCFTVEYSLRIWSVGEHERYRGISGRIRYAVTFFPLVDLVATMALWLEVLFGLGGIVAVLLRLTRVLRVLSLGRRSRTAQAIRLLASAVHNRSVELGMSLCFAGIVLLVSATLLFAVEGKIQPEAFGSIPRAMWWAVATLTTIGYGDVFPVTGWGKLSASLSAVAAIGIVAMPTGIMAAAFSDAFQPPAATAKVLRWCNC
jgi:voltage-gated potassium channel